MSYILFIYLFIIIIILYFYHSDILNTYVKCALIMHISLSLCLLISIFIHVYNMVVGPTCCFFLSYLFSSTHPRILMWFFLSFFLNVLRLILM